MIGQRLQSLQRSRATAEFKPETIHVEARASVHERCPYCHESVSHDALAAFQFSKDTLSCPGCRANMHSDCWDEHGGCATLGCNGRNPRALQDFDRRLRRLRGLVQSLSSEVSAPINHDRQDASRTVRGWSRSLLQSFLPGLILIALTGLICLAPLALITIKPELSSTCLVLGLGLLCFVPIALLALLGLDDA